MSAPTQSQTASQPSVGYTGMDDVLIPTSPVNSIIKSETYPFRALGTGTNNATEGTDVYITSAFFDASTSTVALADRWVARHSDSKTKFQLLSRTAVESQAASAVLDEKGKAFSPPYTLAFESQGAEDYPGTMGDHSYTKRNRQMFYFLPVSAQHIFTARVVRRVQYFEGFPQFETQYEHFLNTLKRDTATLQSGLKGSKPLTRRFYTAYFSFEIYLPEPDTGNQWYINHSSQRSDVWRTQDGDITVNMGVISGYDFDPARENHKLKEDAKALVKKLPGLVKSMGEEEFKSKLTYIEKPFGPQFIYGHADDGGLETEVVLESAYKTGKKFRLYIRAKSTVVTALLPQLYAWLGQFKILQ